MSPKHKGFLPMRSVLKSRINNYHNQANSERITMAISCNDHYGPSQNSYPQRGALTILVETLSEFCIITRTEDYMRKMCKIFVLCTTFSGFFADFRNSICKLPTYSTSQ